MKIVLNRFALVCLITLDRRIMLYSKEAKRSVYAIRSSMMSVTMLRDNQKEEAFYE